MLKKTARLLIPALLLAVVLLGCSREAVVTGQFEEGVKLTAAGEPIDIEIGHLVPSTADWNGDGAKDLIVGQFKDGRIKVFLNEGTDTAPELGAEKMLTAGGNTISMAAG